MDVEVGSLTLEQVQRDGLQQGFFFMKESEYHAVDALSQSALKEYRRSPAHYLHARTSGASNDHDPALVEGSAWHLALLEPERFEQECVVEPKVDRRTKKGKVEYAEFLNKAETKLVITAEQRENILRGIAQMRCDHELGHYINGGLAEVRCFLKDPVLEIWMKGALDYWVPRRASVIDYKTTQNIGSYEFGRSIITYGYHIQAAFYIDLVRLISGRRIDFYGILAMEKKPPFSYKIFELGRDAIEQGRKEYLRLLDKHMQCSKYEQWPLHDELIELWDMPAWARRG